MRSILLAACLLMTGALAALPSYAAPEFVQALYDQFSVNYLDAEALGRGHTGAALPGGVNSVLANPASLQMQEPGAYLEIFLKPGIEEMNKQGFVERDTNFEHALQTYNATTPFGIVGFGFPLWGGVNTAILYSVPQCLQYDTFTRELQTDQLLSLHPSFTHASFVWANAYHTGEFSIGMNTMLDLYMQNEYRSYWVMNKLSDTQRVYRFQPGVRWQHGEFSIGAAYTMAADVTFGMGYGETYDTTIPARVTAGLAWTHGIYTLTFDVDHEWTSEQKADYINQTPYEDAPDDEIFIEPVEFEDRTRLKFGAEFRNGPYTARVGAMHVPGVFEGKLYYPAIPDDSDVSDNEVYWPHENYLFATIDKNDQMFVTGGLSYAFRSGDLHLGLAADVLRDVPVVQLSTGFSLHFSSFAKSMRK